MRDLRMLAVLCSSFAALALPAHAGSDVSYRGADGPVSAYVTVFTYYLGATASMQVCEEDPRYREEAYRARIRYVAANKPVLDAALRRLEAIAWQSGEETERSQLLAQIDSLAPEIDRQLAALMKENRSDIDQCATRMPRIQEGGLDLKRTNAELLQKILLYPAGRHRPLVQILDSYGALLGSHSCLTTIILAGVLPHRRMLLRS